MIAGIPILETKFYLPQWRPDFVSRPRLVRRLDQGVERKLTLISAPAGFGKTTLVAEWLASASAVDKRVAWLSLGANDNHPGTFWTYLISALQTIEPSLGAGTIALFQSLQPPPLEVLLTGLINELSAVPGETVLVLDDYHFIAAEAIHEGITFLLDHLPATAHLVLTGRSDPPLPLGRFRARSELTEIRATDLRFTPEEATAFLNDAMSLNLSAQSVAVLDGRTEGWIAGLNLAALSMQGREDADGFIAAFSGDHRYIVDYLVEEVLQRQAPAVRNFLLQTSVLDRMSGPLCDAVTGEQGGRAMLESLERANLFVVPLDDQRQWYRYHHLFADVLEAHLQEEQPGSFRGLHDRASEWHEQHGYSSDAIRHAVAASNFPRAAALIELAAEPALLSHQSDRLIEWLKPIPPDLIRAMPVLSTYYAWALMGSGELEAGISHLRDAEQWLEYAANTNELGAMVVVDRAGFETLPSRIALARSFLAVAAGDQPATVEHARLALELLPEEDQDWRAGAAILLALSYWGSGDLEAAQRFHADGVTSLQRAGSVVLAISAAYDGADLRKERGRLSEAGRTYEWAIQFAEGRGGTAVPGIADQYLGLSDICCERNDISGAKTNFQSGEELSKQAWLQETPVRLCIARARIQHIEGDLDAALKSLGEAERLHIRGPVPIIRPLAALKTRILLSQGRLDEARDWARAEGLSADDDLSYAREFDHITLARVLIAEFTIHRQIASLDAASRLLERLYEAADAGGRLRACIEILLLLAKVHDARDDESRDLADIERALFLAEPEGYVRVFVDEGATIEDLLQRAVKAGMARAFATQVLSAFTEPASAPPPLPKPALDEPLTAREIEILRLIGAGMRNQQIAEHLVISPSTVKRHLANAYGKLAVSHRTEALLRATELNLL